MTVDVAEAFWCRAGLPDFFLVQNTKTGKNVQNVQNEHKMHQMVITYPKWS
jgi:hypothetical protein